MRLPIGLLALLTFAWPATALQEGATTRVSVMTGCGKAEIGLGSSMWPAISEDGRFVVYSSFSTTLVSGDTTIAWFANLDGQGNFGPLKLITADLNKPTAVDVAMINADDRPDVLTSSFWDKRLAWFYNDLPVSGLFLGPQDISLAMDATTTVATADLDGDGDIDVLGTDIEDGSNKAVWFPGDGLGGLGVAAPISLHAVGARTLFPADLDGDGDLDVAFNLENFPGYVMWQENTTGLGDFSSERVVTTNAPDANTLHAADFDGDGDLDVLTSVAQAPQGPKIAWLRNEDGQGAFGAETVVSTLPDPAAVHAGDLDGDGDVDIVATTELGGNVVWFPNLNGAGSFGAPIVLGTGVASPKSVEAVDLDLDGDTDVLTASSGLGELIVYLNTDGQGSFGPKQLLATGVGGTRSVRSADLDGDRDPDVLLARGAGNEVCWFSNLGAGVLGPKQTVSTAFNIVQWAQAADIDGDGDLDVLSASTNDDKIAWYENLDGLGSFGPQQVISSTADGAEAVFGRDLDGDGDGDVLSVSFFDGRTTWYENSDGLGRSFVGRDLFDDEEQTGRAVLAEDMDGDGDQDVLAAAGGAGDVSWFENPDGLAHFGVVHTVTNQVKQAFSVSGGDLDGDGDVDLLTASRDDDKIAWYRNDGLGGFGPQLVLSSSSDHARSVRASDLDGDGDLDVLAASYLDDTVAWFENLDGAGSFGAEQVITAAADGAQMALAADVDGDGDQDVVSTSFLDDVTAWHENLDGQAGAFAPHVIFDGSTVGATALRVADMDGDGDADVVLASAYPNPDGIEVYRHDRDLLETVWVSKTVDGALSDAANPAVSADGRFVAFESAFGNLVPEPDANAGATDIYVRDLLAGVTTRVDVSSAGVQANNVCLNPRISGDGRYVAFVSYANNLVPGDPTCCNSSDAFLHDRTTGETDVIGRMLDGSWPIEGSHEPDLSADGQHVAFVGGVGYAPEDTNGAPDVFDLHLPTGVIERISLGAGGVQINGGSTSPSISADAQIVAFRTGVAVDPADTSPGADIYVHDRATQVTHFASISMTGGSSNQNCDAPRLSGDGRYVVFTSRATNLVAGTTGSKQRAYRRDLLLGQTTLMSVASDGTEANAEIFDADISGDGKLAVFDSLANNLVPSDTDGVQDVFVHNVDPWFPIGCDLPGDGGAALFQAKGPLLPNSSGLLTLKSGVPFSPAIIFVSLQSQPVPFKGGLLTAFPPVLAPFVFLGATGSLTLPFQWPAGIPAGTEIFFHVALADPTAIQNVALSSAMSGRTP